MARKELDIAGVINTQIQSAAATRPMRARTIDDVTREIIHLKTNVGNGFLQIGRRLIEAKDLLPHGEWGAWLAEQVCFSERAAQSYMQLAREWESNPQALADLGPTKATALLALPAESRAEFIAKPHMVGSAEKTAVEMTSREFARAVKAEIGKPDEQKAHGKQEPIPDDSEAAERPKAPVSGSNVAWMPADQHPDHDCWCAVICVEGDLFFREQARWERRRWTNGCGKEFWGVNILQSWFELPDL